jgi:hypothetical protein
MRKIFLAFAVLAGTVSMLNAQDVITLKNGNEIRAKVLEIGINEVKYKQSANQSGPTYTLNKSDIFRIKFENGDIEVITSPVNQGAPNREKPVRTNQSNQSNQSGANQGYQQGNWAPPVEAEPLRKAYIGIGLGASLLTSDVSYVNSTGYQFNINFGYRFGQHVGIASSMLVTSYAYGSSGDSSVGAVGWMFGPLFTTANATQSVEYDLRPMVGLASGTYETSSSSGSTDDSYLMFGLGASIRWNCAKRVSVSGNLDYYHNLGVGITAGVNFRF